MGKMPWHVPEELQHFKETTLNYPVIMGRKTYDSIGKNLPDRLNIIISRSLDESTKENYMVVSDIRRALEFCRERNSEKVFIVGGAEIFRQTINLADEMILSILDIDVPGDTYFPDIDNEKWDIISEKKHEKFKIITYSIKNS